MSDSPERERYPLNADGPFYVVKDLCLCCMVPEYEAPELMGFDSETMHCYFKRQPETPEEVEHAIMAVLASDIEGLRYSGNDPHILDKLGGAKQLCDIYDANSAPNNEAPDSKCFKQKLIDRTKGD